MLRVTNFTSFLIGLYGTGQTEAIACLSEGGHNAEGGSGNIVLVGLGQSAWI